VVAFFIYLAVFLLYIIGRCIYSSEWVAQIRARNVAFSELENVSMMAVLLVMLFCQLFLVGQWFTDFSSVECLCCTIQFK